MRAVGDARLHPARLCRARNAGRGAHAPRTRSLQRRNRSHDDHGVRALRGARNGGTLPAQCRVHRRQRARCHQRRPRRLHSDLPQRNRRAVRKRRHADRCGADRSLSARFARILQLRRRRRHDPDRGEVRQACGGAGQRQHAAHLRRQLHSRQRHRCLRRVVASAVRAEEAGRDRPADCHRAQRRWPDRRRSGAADRHWRNSRTRCCRCSWTAKIWACTANWCPTA